MANLYHRNHIIFRVAVPAPVDRLFDYLAPSNDWEGVISPGARLEVPFGKSKKIAFLVALSQSSEVDTEKLKPVSRILDAQSLLSAQDMELLRWASRYYHHPLGEVISSAFPVMLRQGKSAHLKSPQCYRLTKIGHAIDSGVLKRAPKQWVLLELFKTHLILPKDHPDLAASSVKAILRQWLSKEWLVLEDVSVTGAASSPQQTAEIACNDHQQAAVGTVVARLHCFGVFLLEGVTGSGKTEVYMQAISAVLALGRQVLVLVPEITLTPQLEQRFRARFAVNIAVSHSRLSDGQRQQVWLSVQQGQCPILLGTRSTLFTPFNNLGLIILDEEHDPSFKQQEGFRFSARDVAVMRGKLQGIPVLLGSATPSLESLFNVENKRYQWLHLPERAGNASEPALRLLDIRNKKMTEGLSEQLLGQIRQTLAKREQVLLFLNRRGFAPTLICHGCGWVARCRRCDANLVVHAKAGLLRCHHCGHEQILPKHCPACQSPGLTALGLGTERVERVLAEVFPGQSVIRLDRDSTQRKGALENYLAQINQGHADIVLGTQMLAKGHHFPNVTLVAIIDVDAGLFSIDFHAQERLAQQIVQVAGRAGRATKPGKVILQTRRPEHPLLVCLINEGYGVFARMALAERQQAGLPPYSHQALLRAEANAAETVQDWLRQVAEKAKTHAHNGLQVLGPIPAPMARRAGTYRYQLLFQSARRTQLHALLDELPGQLATIKLGKKVRWSLDVDPLDFF